MPLLARTNRRRLSSGLPRARVAWLVATLAACGREVSRGSDDDLGSGGQGDGGGLQGPGSSSSGSPTSSSGGGPTSASSGGPGTAAGGGRGGAAECGELDFFGFWECDRCIEESCCGELTACLDDYAAGGDDCILDDESFAEDGALFVAFIACLEDDCADDCSNSAGACGTGVSTNDGDDSDGCIEDHCCAPFIACVGDEGENVDACRACIDEGGGALCDDYLACFDEHCAGS